MLISFSNGKYNETRKKRSYNLISGGWKTKHRCLNEEKHGIFFTLILGIYTERIENGTWLGEKAASCQMK